VSDNSVNDTRVVLPCPFCGSADLHMPVSGAADGGYVSCRRCEADGPIKDTADEAVDAWNVRCSPGVAAVEAERDRPARILAVERGDESQAPEGRFYTQHSKRDTGRWRGPGDASIERWGRGPAARLLRVGRAGYGLEHALLAMESECSTDEADAAKEAE